MQIKININDKEEYAVAEKEGLVSLNNQPQQFHLKKIKADDFLLYRHNKTYKIKILKRVNNQLVLNINDETVQLIVKDHISQILERLGMDINTAEVIEGINAPMPGSILEVAVKDGDEIKQGDRLIILEAMKMENIIKSPTDGKISKVLVKPGENVEKNQPLISF